MPFLIVIFVSTSAWSDEGKKLSPPPRLPPSATKSSADTQGGGEAVVSAAPAAEDNSIDLGEVVVREERATPLDETAAATDIVQSRDAPLATDAVQMLQQSAGVTVRRYGGIDDFSALSLRGSTPGQVQIYLDDVPLVTAQGTITDLSIIPLSAIERVEVYRGGAPGILPESAIGGVVVLRSKKRPEKFEWKVNAGYGSFETLRLGTTQAQPVKNVAYRIAYDFFKSSGDFLYPDNNGTTFNTADDREVRRQNNAFVQNALFTKFDFDLPDNATLAVTDSMLMKSQGVPGLGSRTSLNAHLTTWRNIVALDAHKDDLFTPHLDGQFNLFFDYLKSMFDDPQGEIGLTPQDNDDDTYRFGEMARVSYAAGTHSLTTVVAAHRGEYYVPHVTLGPDIAGSASNRQTVSVALEEDLRFWDERVLISPSVRLENVFNDLTNAVQGFANTASEHQLSAKLGVKVRLIDELYFKGNAYRGFRSPTFTELFGDRGVLIGNPQLKAEEALNFDAGFMYRVPETSWLAGARIEAAYFQSDAENLIQFLQTSQFTAKAQNLNHAMIRGVEASARATFFDRLSCAANYTWQSAKDISGTVTDGKFLPGRPQQQVGAMITWREEWMPELATSLTGELHYASGSFLDTQNLLEVKHQTIINTGISFEIFERATLGFTARNITNDQTVDSVGYPLPGRSYWGSVEVKL